MSRSAPAAIVTLLLVAGCTNPGSAPQGPDREVVSVGLSTGHPIMIEIIRDEGVTRGRIDAPMTEVWPEVARVYADLGLGAETVTRYDPGSHRIAVADHRARRLGDRRLSMYLNCGHSLTAPTIDNGMGRITLETWLAAEGDATVVSTRLSGVARNTGTSGSPIQCSSNGRLEQELLSRLGRRVVDEAG